jgi:uncharacterized protein YjdB
MGSQLPSTRIGRARARSTTHSDRWCVGRAVALLVAAALTATTAAAGQTTAEAAQNEVVGSGLLANSSSGQQRWQSLPGSRIVFNPSGAAHANDLPLTAGYFAKDVAQAVGPVFKTYRTSATTPPPDAPRRVLAWSSAFETTAGWTPEAGLTATAANGVVRTSLAGSDRPWLRLTRTAGSVDVARFHFLTLDVSALSGATTKWAISVWADGKEFIPVTAAGGLRPTTADAEAAGLAEFDLYDCLQKDGGTATFPTSGTKDLRIELWTTDAASRSGAVDWRSVQLHDNGAQPWDGQGVSVAEEFADVSEWTAGGAIGIRSDGRQATVSLGNAGYNKVSKQYTVDLDATPLLSVTVPETTGKWALKVNDTGDANNDRELKRDTADTGTFTFNLKDATNWSGSKTFRVVLYQIGEGTYSVFDQFRIHSGQTASPWLSQAVGRTNTWRPQSLEATAQYSDGRIQVRDVFHDVNSFSRSFTSTLTGGGVAIMGPATGAAWDGKTRTLTSVTGNHAIAYAVPATVPDPIAYGDRWYVVFPAGTTAGAVGVGMAVNSTAVTADPAGAARASAVAALADPAEDLARQTEFWDAYLAGVPTVEDYSIQTVASGGVTADQVKYDYYRAFVDLEMDLLPATPETGNDYPILATGKPSMWAAGAAGAKFAAQWDSLVGMQQLVYVDPDNAWGSFEGLMAGVKATGDAPDQGGDRGILHGESLPSRKAQTAWILYSATGDRARLARVYENVRLNLDWERHNLRWIFADNNYRGELDAEFVSSLAFDLGFAVRIAQTLGREADASHWTTMIGELTKVYEDSFFPDTPDGRGKVWATVQSSFPAYNTSRGTPWQDENGRWVAAGDPLYSHPGFVLKQLDGAKMARVMSRFLEIYDPNDQLAGIDFAKGPDIQLTTYGLLDMDPAQLKNTSQPKTEAQLRGYADVLVNSFIRDTVKSPEFAEELHDSGDIGDPVRAGGVMPSLFSLANYIDFVWLANGFRLDEGNRAFTHLPGRQGGVDGLTYLGEPMSVDIDGDTVAVTSAPLGNPRLHAAEGETVRVADVDKTLLAGTVDRARDLKENAFTTSSWAASGVGAALAKAEALLAAVKADQSQVDAATAELAAAVAALESRGDPAPLAALMAAAEAVAAQLDGFTADSAAALRTALADARATHEARADRTQTQLDAASARLRSALDGLVVKPPVDPANKAVLQALYDSARRMSNAGAYTTGSWSALQSRIAAAKLVLADPRASQATVDAAAQGLNAALIGLVPVKVSVASKVKLNQSQLRLAKGKSFTLVAGVYYTNAAPAYAGAVMWKSSRPEIATVSSSGTVTARKTGTVKVTATTVLGNSSGTKLSTSITVTVVKAKGRAKVTKVSAGVPKSMRKGTSVHVTGKYSSSKATGVKVTYRSSRPGVAQVDPVGRILALSKGTARITVKAGNKARTYTLTVR